LCTSIEAWLTPRRRSIKVPEMWPRPGSPVARVGAVAALMALTWTSSADPAAFAGPVDAGTDPCQRVGEPTVAGTLEPASLVELSGLAASRRHSEVLWAHNDSGAPPELFALGPDGAALGAYAIEGADAVDWEDLAVGPGPGRRDQVLYVGDVGDNRAARPSTTIYRVAEPAGAPDGAGGTLPVLDATALRHPGGPVDIEALVVDPVDGDVLLITKDLLGASRVLQVTPSQLGSPDPVETTEVAAFQVPLGTALTGGLPGTMVTGADVSPDGSVVLVRTYQAVLAFERPVGAPLAEAFATRPCSAPQADEAQGEAIAFTADADAYVTIGEGQGVPVYRFAVTGDDGSAASNREEPEPPSDRSSPPPAADPPPPAAPADRPTAGGWAFVVAGVVALAVLVLVLRRRR
jgi:hypothetical protein